MSQRADKFSEKKQYVLDGQLLGNILNVLAQLPYNQVANLLVPLEMGINAQYDMMNVVKDVPEKLKDLTSVKENSRKTTKAN